MFLSNEYYNELIVVDPSFRVLKTVELSKKVMCSCTLKGNIILGERGCVEVIDIATMSVRACLITIEQVNKVLPLGDGKTVVVGQSYGIIQYMNVETMKFTGGIRIESKRKATEVQIPNHISDMVELESRQLALATFNGLFLISEQERVSERAPDQHLKRQRIRCLSALSAHVLILGLASRRQLITYDLNSR